MQQQRESDRKEKEEMTEDKAITQFDLRFQIVIYDCLKIYGSKFHFGLWPHHVETPFPLSSPKLRNIEGDEYLNERLLRKTRCRKLG